MTSKRAWLIPTLILLVAPGVSSCGYNAIPEKQERALAAWSDVQGQYQRRAALVPNLVATAQAAAVQERGVLNAVIEARARAAAIEVSPDDAPAMARFQASQSELGGALSRLLTVVEAYPQLQSNRSYLALQSQFEGAEHRIGIARRDYNEAVRDYNTELRTFPGVIWAATLHGGVEPMQPFETSETAQPAPEANVNLDAPSASTSQSDAAPGTEERL